MRRSVAHGPMPMVGATRPAGLIQSSCLHSARERGCVARHATAQGRRELQLLHRAHCLGRLRHRREGRRLRARRKQLQRLQARRALRRSRCLRGLLDRTRGSVRCLHEQIEEPRPRPRRLPVSLPQTGRIGAAGRDLEQERQPRCATTLAGTRPGARDAPARRASAATLRSFAPADLLMGFPLAIVAPPTRRVAVQRSHARDDGSHHLLNSALNLRKQLLQTEVSSRERLHLHPFRDTLRDKPRNAGASQGLPAPACGQIRPSGRANWTRRGAGSQEATFFSRGACTTESLKEAAATAVPSSLTYRVANHLPLLQLVPQRHAARPRS